MIHRNSDRIRRFLAGALAACAAADGAGRARLSVATESNSRLAGTSFSKALAVRAVCRRSGSAAAGCRA